MASDLLCLIPEVSQLHCFLCYGNKISIYSFDGFHRYDRYYQDFSKVSFKEFYEDLYFWEVGIADSEIITIIAKHLESQEPLNLKKLSEENQFLSEIFKDGVKLEV